MSREHLEALRAKIGQIEARKPLNRAEALFVMIRQTPDGRVLCGCGCGEPLDPLGEGVIDEHVRALSLLGGNELDNRSWYRRPLRQAEDRHLRHSTHGQGQAPVAVRRAQRAVRPSHPAEGQSVASEGLAEDPVERIPSMTSPLGDLKSESQPESVSGVGHTPGPWVARRGEAHHSHLWVVTADHAGMSANTPLAMLQDFDDAAKADATLIAASPTMYAALVEIAALDFGLVGDIARSAISRGEGKGLGSVGISPSEKPSRDAAPDREPANGES